MASNPSGTNQRTFRVILTGLVTLGVKGASFATGLISLPLMAQYLGLERFGLWLLISTVLTWMSLTDLGLANSLTNAIATADGHNNHQQAKTAVASTFWLMMGIASLLAIGFGLVYPWIPWERVFNVTSDRAKAEAGQAILAGFLIFALRLPLAIPGRIYIAYQEGYIYQIWAGLGSWLSLGALLLGIHFQISLPGLVIAGFGTALLADILCAIHLFTKRRPQLKPTLQSFDWVESQVLLKMGLQFWIAQITAVLSLQTDLIVVSQIFGAEAVASYGAVLKLFSMISLVQLAFLTPLWSAYSEAFARGDWVWLRQTFQRSLRLSLCGSVLGGLLVWAWSPWIVTQWMGVQATPQPDLTLAMLATTVLTAMGQCLAFFLNGLGKIRTQVIWGLASGLLNLLLSVILAHRLGVAGVAWATAISVGLFSVLILGREAIASLKTLSGPANPA